MANFNAKWGDFKIREIKNSYAIKGNKEERMVDFHYTDLEKDKRAVCPLYWNLKNISKRNYEYIESLPETLSFSIEDTKIYMAHSPSQHFGYGIIDGICGRTFHNQFGVDYTNHTEYLHYIKNKIQTDISFMKTLSEKPDGVFIWTLSYTMAYKH